MRWPVPAWALVVWGPRTTEEDRIRILRLEIPSAPPPCYPALPSPRPPSSFWLGLALCRCRLWFPDSMMRSRRVALSRRSWVRRIKKIKTNSYKYKYYYVLLGARFREISHKPFGQSITLHCLIHMRWKAHCVLLTHVPLQVLVLYHQNCTRGQTYNVGTYVVIEKTAEKSIKVRTFRKVYSWISLSFTCISMKSRRSWSQEEQ